MTDDIELVIKIPHHIYQKIKENTLISARRSSKRLDYILFNAVANSILFPKGHGRMIDISQIDKDKIESDNPVISLTIDGEYVEAVSLDYINGLTTIVDADEGRGERMSMYITDKELQKFIDKVGYKGCTNCKHQIAPLRACKWAEQGGDGRIHLICPKWDKIESEET